MWRICILRRRGFWAAACRWPGRIFPIRVAAGRSGAARRARRSSRCCLRGTARICSPASICLSSPAGRRGLSCRRIRCWGISRSGWVGRGGGYIAIEKPPSTGIAAPVTKSDAELARNAATPAMSSAVPHLPCGVRFSTLSCRPCTCCRARFVSSVSIQPGSTALTWMLSFAHAVAIARDICTMPPLLEVGHRVRRAEQ